MGMGDSIVIRREQAADFAAIRAVNETAFGRADEAVLVDSLRNEGAVLASFVADYDGGVVGHVLFSRMLIETATESIPAVALAPLAVLPGYQRQGIGSRLVRDGLQWLLDHRERFVLVLGDPGFYERFGFTPARATALTTPFPPDAFMALELVPNALDEVRGAVRYAVAFGL
jgi:putative acetyltransferase